MLANIYVGDLGQTYSANMTFAISILPIKSISFKLSLRLEGFLMLSKALIVKMS